MESRHNNVTKAKLAERRAQILDSLAAGTVTDLGEYRQWVGHLRGLDEAAKLGDDADYELNGGS